MIDCQWKISVYRGVHGNCAACQTTQVQFVQTTLLIVCLNNFWVCSEYIFDTEKEEGSIISWVEGGL